MTAYLEAAPPYIAGRGPAQQHLTARPLGGLKALMTEQKTSTKAELAAAARKAAKAALEAKALRENLRRRKAQARATQSAPPGQGEAKCR